MSEVEKKSQAIQQLVEKNRKTLPEQCQAQRLKYPERISELSGRIAEYCESCEETGNYQKMLHELASDLPKLKNPSPAVRRSIEKRFKVIIKHLQGQHGLSTPNQFTEGGITIGASVLGMAGFAVMAFNMNFLYPLAGLILGGFIGFLWGKSRDKKAEEDEKQING
jgi:hypothetical protein